MSETNLGVQIITFDYQEPATAKDFNKLLRGVVKPGIYSGGQLSKIDNSTVSIAPFIALFYVGIDKAIVITTSSSISLTADSDNPILYMTFSWADTVHNYIDFGFRSSSSQPITNEICLGTIGFTGSIVNGNFDYSRKTSGLFDSSYNLYATNLLKFDTISNTYLTKSATNTLYTPNNLTVGGKITGDIPVGSIMAWLPGYFANSSNGFYTEISITLPAWWKKCDGTAPNDPESPVWNSPSRYLPNLTDNRFLMGSTLANKGSIGGQNSFIISTSNLPPHTHTYHASVAYDGDAPASTYLYANIDEHIYFSSNQLADTGDGANVQVFYAQTKNGDFANSAIENRPVYLAVEYIIRIK